MKKISKDFLNPPKGLTECFEKNEAAILNEKHQHKAKDCYRTKSFEKFDGCCAYCGEYRSKLDVDHYRPKGSNAKDSHSGYYWLVYEWSNLVLACSYCNRDAKKSRFPIAIENNRCASPVLNGDGKIDRNKQVINSDVLTAEQPLILNPYLDSYNEEEHFAVKANGMLIGKTLAGKTTIDILDLNRGDILLLRKKIFDTIIMFLETFMDYLKLKIYSQEKFIENCTLLIKKQLLEAKYTDGFHFYREEIFKHYKECIISKFNDNLVKSLLRTAFEHANDKK